MQLHHTILEAINGMQIQGHVTMTPRDQRDAVPNENGRVYTTDFGSASGSPNASATPGYTTFPSTTFKPRNRLGSFLQASFQPSRASFLAYGNVAFVNAKVDVRGTPPGIFATA